MVISSSLIELDPRQIQRSTPAKSFNKMTVPHKDSQDTRNVLPGTSQIPDYTHHLDRLKTLSSDPINLDPEIAQKISSEGFYYDRKKEKIVCFCCQQELNQSDKEYIANPSTVHLVTSTHCPFADRVNMGDNENEDLVYDPKHKQYSSLEVRQHSFRDWPPDAPKICNQLAEAGMFSVGYKTSTVCYNCDWKRSTWSSSEDPWKVHGTSSNTCRYVRVHKGDEFLVSLAKCAVKKPGEKICPCESPGLHSVYIPCGHVLSCSKCLAVPENCPVCTSCIQKKLTLYM